MSDSVKTATEALRVLRRIDTTFSDNSSLSGSGFVGKKPGTVITCAHVVMNPHRAKSVKVDGKAATIAAIDEKVDLAVLAVSDQTSSQFGKSTDLAVGCGVMFAGFPTGVAAASVFGGILSAAGDNLVKKPRCRLLQINGMINAGNSGGPVFELGSTQVVGVITAKFVPLLVEVDALLKFIRSIPQAPSEVGIGTIDFSKFFNLVIQALRTVSGSLRLVQVGTGYAVPIELLPKL